MHGPGQGSNQGKLTEALAPDLCELAHRRASEIRAWWYHSYVLGWAQEDRGRNIQELSAYYNTEEPVLNRNFFERDSRLDGQHPFWRTSSTVVRSTALQKTTQAPALARIQRLDPSRLFYSLNLPGTVTPQRQPKQQADRISRQKYSEAQPKRSRTSVKRLLSHLPPQ